MPLSSPPPLGSVDSGLTLVRREPPARPGSPGHPCRQSGCSRHASSRWYGFPPPQLLTFSRRPFHSIGPNRWTTNRRPNHPVNRHPYPIPCRNRAVSVDPGFSREPYDFELGDDQGTVVTLDGIDQEYRAQLADASELGSYLLNTLPVSFPESEYGPAVNRWLGDQVRIRTVQVSLKVGIEPEARVEPRIVYDLDPPEFEWVSDPRGTAVAGVWYSHSQHRSRLGSRSPEDDSGDAGGFLFKLKGFTLGNRLSLKSLWPRLGGGALTITSPERYISWTLPMSSPMRQETGWNPAWLNRT